MAPELLGVVEEDGSPASDTQNEFSPNLTKLTDVYGFAMVGLEVR